MGFGEGAFNKHPISDENMFTFLPKVDEREEREETNRKRRLQREKARRREEKKEDKGERQSRSREENNSDATRRRGGSVDEEDGGGCAHCSSSVAAECVYLCQKGHLHRDLPGEVTPSLKFCYRALPLYRGSEMFKVVTHFKLIFCNSFTRRWSFAKYDI